MGVGGQDGGQNEGRTGQGDRAGRGERWAAAGEDWRQEGREADRLRICCDAGYSCCGTERRRGQAGYFGSKPGGSMHPNKRALKREPWPLVTTGPSPPEGPACSEQPNGRSMVRRDRMVADGGGPDG